MSAQAQCENRYDLEQQAALLFEKNDIPLDSQGWQQLAELLAK